MKNFLQLCIAIKLLIVAAAAQATFYSYSIDNPAGSTGGGDIKNITTSYSTTSQIFSWEYTIDAINDGFWLVVSDGPNPKGIDDQLAILYGDLNNNLLTAYQYNGLNSSSSYSTPGILLQQWSNVFTTVNTGPGIETTSFSIDVSGINSAINSSNWEGIQFGEQIGIWFHPSRGSNFTYNDDREITAFTRASAGWHDSSNQTTTEEPVDPNEIPSPNALLLMVLGLLSLAYARHHQPIQLK